MKPKGATVMQAVKERAINYINEMPEEQVFSALDYLRFLSERRPSYEITTKEEFYKNIEEGLEDIRQGRVRPFRDVMDEIKNELQLRIQNS